MSHNVQEELPAEALVAATDPATSPRRRKGSRAKPDRPLTWLYLATFVIGIGIWALGAQFGHNPLTPSPLEVIGSFGKTIANGSLWQNTLASLQRVVIGFLIGILVAIPAGFLMGWYRWARGLLEPWVQFFRTVPPLALIPLVIVFLGIGETAKIFVIFLAAFLTSVIATFQGVRNVDVTLINAARVLGAGDLTIFMRVVVPASLPMIFVGMRVALGAAWATLVASELIAAAFGLGRMMQSASQFLDTPRIVVGIIMIGVLGFVMDRLLLLLERRLTSWQEVR
ncbi:MAG: ABC transporter permease [Lacisediminihabitans sp.]